MTRLARRAREEDHGVALAAVIGLMAVGLLLTSLILASVVGGLGYTSSTRAGVQSQASADAGIAAARAGVEAGTCAAKSGKYVSAVGATPKYSATVYHPNGAGTWVAGCPTDSTAQIRIVALGSAVATGVNGTTAGNNTSVEAIFAPAAQSTTIVASGVAVYSYAGSGLSNGISMTGAGASLEVKSGVVNCSNASSGAGDWIVQGTLNTSGTCTILGNVWATGKLTMSNSVTISGDVSATGLDMTNNSTIEGNAWINGNSTFSNTASVDGNLNTKTAASGYASHVGGTTKLVNPVIGPLQPVVPDWIEFNYKKSDWTGFTENILPSSKCDSSSFKTYLNALPATPQIIDATVCSSVATGDQLALRSDMVIVAKGFNLTTSGDFHSSTSAAHRLWLIIPDQDLTDHVPTCPTGGGGFAMSNSFAINAPISAMIYSPCTSTLSNSTSIHGQLYTNIANVSNAVQISYVPVGLPGVNMGTGATTSTTTTGAGLLPVSKRNIAP